MIFNFHAYASLIHNLTYKRKNHENCNVHGYRERGNINTPLELAIRNGVSRHDLVIDAIDRIEPLRDRGAHLKERMRDAIVERVRYAHENRIDAPDIRTWKWPAVT